MTVVSMTVNGKPVSADVEARTLLVNYIREAFREHHGLQCGFCTPGMIMTAVDLIRRKPELDEHTVREELEGNLCRCTGYHNIVKAILAASEEIR